MITKSGYARTWGGACIFALLVVFSSLALAEEQVLYRVNAGGPDYTDSVGQLWQSDDSFVGSGSSYSTTAAIAGTSEQALYQSERWGGSWEPAMHYSFSVDPGTYTVRLHFAEIYSGISTGNPRVFDVGIEGAIVLNDYDIFGTVGYAVAVVEEFPGVVVTDTTLDIEFLHVLENPKISAIEIAANLTPAPTADVAPDPIDFGTTELPDAPLPISITVANTGDADLHVSGVSILGTDSALFDTDAAPPYTIAPGGSTSFSVSFLSPDVAGSYAGLLEVVSDAPDSPASLPINADLIEPAAPALDVTPSAIDFGQVTEGSASADETLVLKNIGGSTLTVTSLSLSGTHASDFEIVYDPVPFSLAPQASTDVLVALTPSAIGARNAAITIVSDDPAGGVIVPLTGEGVAPATEEVLYRINAGGPDYTDPDGNLWVADGPYVTSGSTYIDGTAIDNTVMDPLYQSERWVGSWQAPMVYTIPVEPGDYAVRLHFAEIYTGINAGNPRVFDVYVEGQPVLTNYDIYGTVGYFFATVEQADVTVADSALEITFGYVQENPKISAIEIIRLAAAGPTPKLRATPAQVDFGDVAVGKTSAASIVTLENAGTADLEISSLSLSGAQPAAFGLTSATLPIVLAPGATSDVSMTLTPDAEGPLAATLDIASTDPGSPAQVPLSGVGVIVPIVSVDSTSLNFGDLTVGDTSPVLTLTVTNIDTQTHNLHMVELVGTDPGDFAIVSAPATPVDIAPGATFTVDVSFAPIAEGLREAEVKLHFDSHGTHVYVPIQGNGTAPPPVFSVTPSSLDFSTVEVGTTSPYQTITVTNIDSSSHNLELVDLVGPEAADFSVVGVPSTPVDIAPSSSVTVDVAFAPSLAGLREASVALHFDADALHVYVPASGTGELPAPVTSVLYRVNAGGPDYTDAEGNLWLADAGYYNTGYAFSTGNAVSGTDKTPLYQTERWDEAAAPEMAYSFAVDPGRYQVTLHFAEIYDGITGAGQRVFDVAAEGQLVLDDYDIFAAAGYLAAVAESFEVDVADGSLDVEFLHQVENPKISAIEVASVGQVKADVYQLSWGHVSVGAVGDTKYVALTNTGDSQVTISTLSFLINQGVGHDFTATLAGNDYTGDHLDVTHDVFLTLAPQASVVVPVVFTPTEESDNNVTLEFGGDFAPVPISLLGIGGDYTGHPYLHVVIGVDPFAVDYDQDGFEDIYLEGEYSHTHEVGHVLTAYEWSAGGVAFASTANTTASFPVGEHTVALRIWDDNEPPETLSAEASFTVAAPDAVPGVLALYYDGATAGPAALLGAVPANADFAETLPGLLVENQGGYVGGSPFTEDAMVRLLGEVNITASGSYEFAAIGGSDARLFVGGVAVTGPVALDPGGYAVDARFAVATLADLPVAVEYAVAGGAFTPIDGGLLIHDQTAMKPVINDMPSEGIDLGGYVVTIAGLGFFPTDEVIVHWGDVDYTGVDLTVTPTAVTVVVPPGAGTVVVTVETPNGVSNVRTFTYSATGPVPVNFTLSDLATGIPAPTVATWGQDGRLYVGGITGTITALTFDDNYNLVDSQVINTLESAGNPNILGIAANPLDPPGTVRIYVAHSLLFANGGTCFEGISPYSGEISVLTGPDFDVAEPLITGLPVSNHDHGVNGLQFDNNGDLYIAVGGNTNAGIPDCNIGGTDESPLSAAVLKAEISKPDFNGEVVYVESATGAVSMDQVYGGIVDVADGVDVHVFGAGFRNPFDLVFTQSGRLYNTENGPNLGFGPASTGPDTQTDSDVTHDDELNLLELGNYYGHPNRNRGRYDERQYVYHDNIEAPVLGEFTQALATFEASTNGLIEYTADTFNGAMRGDLIAQKWNGPTHRIELTPDGRAVAAKTDLPVSMNCLDIVQGPGGVIIGADYSDNKLVIARPVDIAATGLTAYDIRPWRAPATGGHSFVIGGSGFGDLANTSVTIGGVPATVQYVTPSAIHGLIPAAAAPTADFLDVAVTVGGVTKILTNGFRYLFPEGQDDTEAAAHMVVDPGSTILGSSTYNANSFLLTNASTRGQKIERIRFDLRTSIFPDIVFDPDGIAGDPVGKPFTADTDPGLGLAGDATWQWHDDGYDVLEVAFNDFDPGETLGFSIDVDPTSIRGATPPGPNDSGSISGLEMTGATVTVHFDDGTALVGYPYRIVGSDTGSEVLLMAGLPPKPSVEVLGIAVPATTTNAGQTVRVAGPVGYDVSLLVVEGALYVDGVPGGGYDLDPYEANTAINVTEYSGVIGGGGYVDLPVTLTQSDAPDGGLNYITAVLVAPGGATGPTADPLVLQLDPP